MVNLLTYKVIDGDAPEQHRRVTTLQAQALANDFLSDSLPNQFTANLAEWVDHKWQVSVILAYPQIGSLGAVGEVQVGSETVKILHHTLLEQMRQTGIALYTANQDVIEAAFP
jgi:hypothetical protein